MISGSQKKQNDFGEKWAVAAALVDGEKNYEELYNYFRVFLRRFGLFFFPEYYNEWKIKNNLSATLSALLNCKWANYNEHTAKYNLTERGMNEARKMLHEVSKSKRIFNKLMTPTKIARLTFGVHLFLSAIKLPAALLSGSISLLNDALDTIIDAFSSLAVYLGIRNQKETLASYIIFLFMALTGGYALWETIIHFIEGNTITPSPMAYLAILLTSFFSLGLWILQKIVGLRAGSLAIIAQSIDSRNHLIVALGVLISFVASWLGTPLIDLIIGLIIALIILKSAWELFRDIRMRNNEEPIDFSSYGFIVFEKLKEKQISKWLLFLIYSGKIENKQQLLYEAGFSVNFENNNQLEAIGLSDSSKFKSEIQRLYHSLLDNHFIEEKDCALFITEAGKQQVKGFIRNKMPERFS